MGNETNEKYVRYMIARLSAYRNVWWSLANEWDIPRLKVAVDWERIGFFRSVMEQAPVREMKPELINNGDPADLNNNIYIFSKPGEYYLVNTANAEQIIEINLDGDVKYGLEIIDKWNMKIIEQAVAEPGLFKYKTIIPFTLLRIVKNE